MKNNLESPNEINDDMDVLLESFTDEDADQLCQNYSESSPNIPSPPTNTKKVSNNNNVLRKSKDFSDLTNLNSMGLTRWSSKKGQSFLTQNQGNKIKLKSLGWYKKLQSSVTEKRPDTFIINKSSRNIQLFTTDSTHSTSLQKKESVEASPEQGHRVLKRNFELRPVFACDQRKSIEQRPRHFPKKPLFENGSPLRRNDSLKRGPMPAPYEDYHEPSSYKVKSKSLSKEREQSLSVADFIRQTLGGYTLKKQNSQAAQQPKVANQSRITAFNKFEPKYLKVPSRYLSKKPNGLEIVETSKMGLRRGELSGSLKQFKSVNSVDDYYQITPGSFIVDSRQTQPVFGPSSSIPSSLQNSFLHPHNDKNTQNKISTETLLNEKQKKRENSEESKFKEATISKDTLKLNFNKPFSNPGSEEDLHLVTSNRQARQYQSSNGLLIQVSKTTSEQETQKEEPQFTSTQLLPKPVCTNPTRNHSNKNLRLLQPPHNLTNPDISNLMKKIDSIYTLMVDKKCPPQRSMPQTLKRKLAPRGSTATYSSSTGLHPSKLRVLSRKGQSSSQNTTPRDGISLRTSHRGSHERKPSLKTAEESSSTDNYRERRGTSRQFQVKKQG